MKILACLLAVMLGSFALSMPAPAEAGSSTDAALALGSFAVLNQLVHGDTILHDLFGRPRVVAAPVVVQPAPRVVYAPPPVVYAPAPVYYVPAPVYYTPAPTVIYAPAPGHRHFIPPGHARRIRYGHR